MIFPNIKPIFFLLLCACLSHHVMAFESKAPPAERCEEQEVPPEFDLFRAVETRDALGPAPKLFALSGEAFKQALATEDPNICWYGTSLLMMYVGIGREETVKQLLAAGADPNRPVGSNGINALDLAVAYSQDKLARVLIDHGADASVVSDEGWTALHFLTISPRITPGYQGEIRLARLLLQKGAPLDTKGPRGQTALMMAIDTEKPELALFLLGQGADPTQTDGDRGDAVLAYAVSSKIPIVQKKMLPVVKALLKRKVNVNAQNQQGNTALHRAAEVGNLAAMRILINQGKADIHLKNDAQQTAQDLIEEAEAQDRKIAELLTQVKSGTVSEFATKLRQIKFSRLTPDQRQELILTAILNRRDDWIRELLQQGFDANEVFSIKSEDEPFLITPLLYAIASRAPLSVVESLVMAGADVSLGQEGLIPLNFALSRGEYETAQLLLEHGANANEAEQYSGKTPLMELIISAPQSSNRQAVYQLMDKLIEKGADINARDKRGYTAISWAVRQMDQKLVTALLQRGAQPNLTNVDGSTPLHLAAIYGDSAIVALLLQAGADACQQNKAGLTPQDMPIRPEQEHLYLQLFRVCSPSIF